MIAVVHVELTRGMFTSASHLREFAATIYEFEEPLAQQQRAEGLQRYIADMRAASVYSCRVHPAAQALFIWLTNREFEIVIETFHHGHLMRSTESVVREFRSRLKQSGLAAKLYISLQSPGDAQTYIIGMSNAFGWNLWEGLKDNLVGLIIGVIIAIVAKIAWPNFYEEALAAVFGLLLFSLWEVVDVLRDARRKSIHWRIL